MNKRTNAPARKKTSELAGSPIHSRPRNDLDHLDRIEDQPGQIISNADGRTIRKDAAHTTPPSEQPYCPLCHKASVSHIESHESRSLIEDWKRTFEMDVASELRGNETIDRHDCEDCTLSFYWPLSTAGSGQFYEGLQKFDWYYMPDKWEHQQTLPLIDPGNRLLEIGCAEGSFLENAKKARNVTAMGLEINEQAAEDARRKGIDVACGTVESFAQSNREPFDFVCAFQVLEHVVDPKGFLEACLSLLRPGGKLAIGVPNEDSFLKHQWTLLNMPPHHLTRWSEATFQKLATRYDLSHCEIYREPLAKYHIDGYVQSWTSFNKQQSKIHRLIWSKPIRKLRARCLRLGLNRWATGQTLLAILQKPSGVSH